MKEYNFFEKLLYWGFLNNSWVSFHMLLAAIGARILSIWFLPVQVFLIGTAAAILWEAGEYFFQNIIKVYGSRERFFFDAGGDTLGAQAIIALIVFGSCYG